ncbi:MAG: hypothetical protein ACLTZN_03030 [Streptococcus sp.]
MADLFEGRNHAEKELFSQTMIEFFAPIENQRYLESTGKGIRSNRIFRCTKPLDKRKEDALPEQTKRAWVSMTSSIPEVPKVAPFSLMRASRP